MRHLIRRLAMQFCLFFRLGSAVNAVVECDKGWDRLLELDHFGYRPHVGIASGQFWSVISGPPAWLSLTVLGGVVNLAARLGSKADELEICLTTKCLKLVAEQLQLGDHFSIHEFSANLKGIGETPCVKLRCNLKWYPQCAFKTVLI